MKNTAALIAIAGSLSAAAPLLAQTRVTVVPSVSISSNYDNNLFATQNASSDEMVQFTPGFDAYYDSPSATIQGLYSFDAQRAVGHPILNSMQARRHGIFDSSFKPNPQFHFALTGRYDETVTPSELNFETGVLLDRRRATRWQATPAIDFQMTPRSLLKMQFDHTQETLAQSIGGQMDTARIGVSRQQTPRNTWSLTYLGRQFANAGDTYRSHALLAGWTVALSPTASFSIQGGPRVSDYGTSMPEVLATFAKRARLAKLGADYWQGETIVLGIRGPVHLQSGTMKTAWQLRRTVEVGAHAGAFHIETLQGAAARVFHGELVGSWAPAGPYIIAASYGVDFQKGDVRSPLLSEKQIWRNVFLLRFTVAPRWSSAFRPRDPNDINDPADTSKGVSR